MTLLLDTLDRLPDWAFALAILAPVLAVVLGFVAAISNL